LKGLGKGGEKVETMATPVEECAYECYFAEFLPDSESTGHMMTEYCDALRETQQVVARGEVPDPSLPRVAAVCCGDDPAMEGQIIAVADTLGFVRVISAAEATFRLFSVVTPGALPWGNPLQSGDREVVRVGEAQNAYVTCGTLVPGVPRCLVFALDGLPRLMYSCWGEVASDDMLRVLELGRHDRCVTAVAVGDSGALIASGDTGGTLRLWSASALLTGRRSAPRGTAPCLHSGDVTAVAVLETDGAEPRVISAGADGLLAVTCGASAAVLHRIEHPAGLVNVVSPFDCGFSTHGDGFAVGGARGLYVYGAREKGDDPDLLYALPAQSSDDGITGVSQHPCGDRCTLCAVSTHQGRVTVLERGTLRGVTDMSPGSSLVHCAVVRGAGDAMQIASISSCGALWLWPLAGLLHDAETAEHTALSPTAEEEEAPAGEEVDIAQMRDKEYSDDEGDGEFSKNNKALALPPGYAEPLGEDVDASLNSGEYEGEGPLSDSVQRQLLPDVSSCDASADTTDPPAPPQPLRKSPKRRPTQNPKSALQPAIMNRDKLEYILQKQATQQEASQNSLSQPLGQGSARAMQKLAEEEAAEFDPTAYATAFPEEAKRATMMAPLRDTTNYASGEMRYTADLPALLDPPTDASLGVLTRTVDPVIDSHWLAGRAEDPSAVPLPPSIAKLLPRTTWLGEAYDCPPSLCEADRLEPREYALRSLPLPDALAWSASLP